MKGFLVAGGSVPGTDHTMPGQPGWKNNQDAFAHYSDERCLVAVVSDGCGSGPHCEVGAQIVSRLMVRGVRRLIAGDAWNPRALPAALEVLKDSIVADITSAAWPLTWGRELYTFDEDDQPHGIVPDYFFCTTLFAAIAPDWAGVVSFGDGYYAVNGEVAEIEPAPVNAPPYLAQCLVPGCMPEPYLHFRVHMLRPATEIRSILVATDGVRYLPQGELDRFCNERRFVDNPENIRRRLAVINREHVEKGIIKQGPLADDTTVAVIQRTGA